MLALALTLLVAAADDSTESSSTDLRQGVRGHLDISGGVGFGLGRMTLLGAALHFEGGLVLSDRYLLSVRVTAASMLVNNLVHAGLSFGAALGERTTLSAGAAFAMMIGPGDPGLTLGAQFPVRATVLLTGTRAPSEQNRRGLIIGIEAAPGFTRFVYPAVLGATFSAALTIGWATW
jgi:hypothetical protein